MPGARPFDYVHGLATTLTTALTHPVIQSLPMGVRAATAVFRNIHSALGLMNINFPDTRREENRVALDIGPLYGHRTGVGVATDGLAGALDRRDDVQLHRYLVSFRADAAEGEAFRFLNPARRDTLCEVQIAAPEMTSSRWQKPDRTSEAVALP